MVDGGQMRKQKQAQPREPGKVLEVVLYQTKTGILPAGMILFWENYGGTEVAVCSCPHCDHFLPVDDEFDAEGMVTCPSCAAKFQDGDSRSCMQFKAPYSRIAAEVAYWFGKAGRQATIRLKRFKSKTTFRRCLEEAGTPAYKKMLTHARSQKAQEWAEYPASRLSADLAAGKDLVQAIEAFLKA